MASSGLVDLRNQALHIWRNLGRPQQIAIVAIAALALVTVVTLLTWARTPEYTTLFSNLSEADAAAIVAKLKESKTPYQLASGGTSILVPANLVYDTRLQIASSGLPQGGGVGFELFNQTNFGMTDFAQKVNYQRALEGELGRTISHLVPVEQARVHIVIPQPTLYTDQQKETTASVVLKLRPGQRLSDGQIKGIAQLVSSSVEGLKTENLTIVDANGNILSDVLTSNKDARKISLSQLDSQKAFEGDLEQRIQGMLDRVLGFGRATVRVRATLDWDQFESSSEIYSPASNAPQVRSSRETIERYGEMKPEAGGVPGAQTNVPGYTGITVPTAPGQGQYEKKDSTTNYELSKTVEKLSRAPGAVKKLSVAVVLDGSQAIEANQVEEVRNLVAAAAGIDPARGDVLTVSSIPFNRETVAEDVRAMEEAQRWERYLQAGRIGAMAIGPVLLLLVLAFLLRRGRKMMYEGVTQLPSGVKAELPPPRSAAALAGAGVHEETIVVPSQPLEDAQQRYVREQVISLVKTQPNVVADLIKSWMKEDRS